jgi:small GTP-binding protein
MSYFIEKKFRNISIDKSRDYFSNTITIDDFYRDIVSDLAFWKNIALQVDDSKRLIEMENRAFNLLIDRVELEKRSSRVEVGVIGSFSSGKSTFINSLFGKSVCPMAVQPTTSSITKFYYGHQEEIIVDGREITKKEYQDISQHQKGKTKNSKTEYIEYAYPFESFNSIILYDTPGFNNTLNSHDTDVTMKTLESVDVIFFVIDISKGSIDMESIKRIHALKDKRVYCILNKSDLKLPKAIAKIKKEIESEKLFLEVIEYSAINVLKESEKDYFGAYIKHIEEKLIPKEREFKTVIEGVSKRVKSRVEDRVEYQLKIDDKLFKIDSFYKIAKAQRARVEKMLGNLAKSKQFTLNQKLKLDRYNYRKDSCSLVRELIKKSESSELKRELNRFLKGKEQKC